MTIPPGFLFRPSDELLVSYYLERKFMGLPLPSDLIIERDIYGVGHKAPWQIFTDEDPWEICKTNGKNGNSSKREGTIYVFTTLIKASKNRIARTAGCGVWHAETALENVLDDQGRVIGYKKMLCFQITNDQGVMDGSVSKGHWIMHEFSRCGGNTDESQVEYVLCRIKRQDSKFTKKSKRVKNLEAATKDHDDIAPKPAKRVRTEFVEEHKMVHDIDAATETEVMPFSEEVVVQEPSFTMSDDPNEFTVEEFLALWEQDRRGSHSLRMSDESNDLIAVELEALLEEEKQGSNQESDMLFHATEEPSPAFSFSNELFLEQQKKDMFNYTSQDMVAGYIEEPISLLELEGQPSFDLAFDAFGNNPLIPKVVPSGHVLASSAPVGLDTSQDMVAGYIEEPVSLLESEGQPNFDLAFDAFGNNLFTPEDTSQEQFLTYLREQDLLYQESLWSGEPNCFGVGLLI